MPKAMQGYTAKTLSNAHKKAGKKRQNLKAYEL